MVFDCIGIVKNDIDLALISHSVMGVIVIVVINCSSVTCQCSL